MLFRIEKRPIKGEPSIAALSTKRTQLHNRLDLANTMEAVHRVDHQMPSRLRDLSINQALVMLLGFLRLLLWGAIILNLGIESLEMTVARDIHHLALFSILILFANLQLSISKFLLSMEDDERAKKLFVMAVLTLAAGFLQVVELGLDQLLIYLSQGPKELLFRILLFVEFLFGIATTLVAGYSMDRFFVLLKAKTKQLSAIKI